MKFSGQRFLVLAVLLAAWSNFASAQATITSISPTTIQTAGSLTISGSGFGTTQGLSNSILFSGVPASPRIVASSWTATKIVVTVPASAISGPVSVKVATTTSNAVNLTVTPTVSGVTPTSALPGTQVTVTGSGFGNTQAIGTSSIAFNGVPALPSTWSSTSIVVTVPGSATSGSVTVTVAGQSCSGSSLFTPTPNITAISPAQAATGTPVAISGNSFGPSQGSSSVMFNGVAAEVTNWTNTAVEAIVPNATSGTVTITVNGVPSNGSPFAVSPGITSISPNPGLAGSTVTIFGTSFGSTQGSSTVTFNGLAAAVSNWSNGVIVALVPPSVTAGPVVVTVNGMSSNGLGFSLPLPYHYSVSYAPNGAVLGVNDSVNGIWSYRYDDFNRLSSACRTDVPLGLEFQYDQYGNRWQQNITAGTAGTSQLTFAAAANATRTGNCYHAAGLNNQPDGFCFDAAGNLLSDGVHTYTYDAENRIISVDSGQTATYLYNGLGHRVSKGTGASKSEFLYDLSGNLITEVGSTGDWIRSEIYSARKHVGTYKDGTTYFTQADWLGTERTKVLPSGDLFETCVSLPFGDGLKCDGSTDASPNHFTGHERDSESGLDYFGARYYSPALGRFVTPDWSANAAAIPYASFGNPQTLNLYAYTKNNPATYGDPDGHIPQMTMALVELWSKIQQSAEFTGALKAVHNWAASGAVYGPIPGLFTPPAAVSESTGLSGMGTGTGQQPVLEKPKGTREKIGYYGMNAAPLVLGAAGGVTEAVAGPEIVDMTAAVNARSVLASASGNVGGVVGAVDTATGNAIAATSVSADNMGAVNPTLAALAEQQLGGVGASTPGVTAPVGCCAEFQAVNQLLNLGADLDDIRLTPVIRPRTGDLVPKCTNCGILFQNN